MNNYAQSFWCKKTQLEEKVQSSSKRLKKKLKRDKKEEEKVHKFD